MASESATASKVLVSAESLFAINGYAGVSLRQITAAAQVNLAAVNYHFYDKETLYREALTRRLRQINLARTELLLAAEARATDGIAPLADIMDALARPVFLPADDIPPAAFRLLGRVLLERHPQTDELLDREFQPTMTRFGQALRRHMPGMPPQDFLWRFSFIIGALHHSLATLHEIGHLTQGICRDADAEAALANFMRFALVAVR